MESDQSGEICKFCDRKRLNLNHVNWERHKTACKTKEDKENKKKRKNTSNPNSITKFFKLTPKS